MALFILEMEHLDALIEGHVLELRDPASNLVIELMLDPHIGQVRLMRSLFEGALQRLMADQPKAPPDPPQAHEFLPNRYTRRDE